MAHNLRIVFRLSLALIGVVFAAAPALAAAPLRCANASETRDMDVARGAVLARLSPPMQTALLSPVWGELQRNPENVPLENILLGKWLDRQVTTQDKAAIAMVREGVLNPLLATHVSQMLRDAGLELQAAVFGDISLVSANSDHMAKFSARMARISPGLDLASSQLSLAQVRLALAIDQLETLAAELNAEVLSKPRELEPPTF